MNIQKQENSKNQGIDQSIASLYLNQEYSDVSFIVDEEKIYDHKLILAIRSLYFKNLLFGDFTEASTSEIRLIDVPVDAFKELLKYIYTGSIFIKADTRNVDLAIKIFDLAHEYCMENLEMEIAENRAEIMDADNVMQITEMANIYNLSELLDDCLSFIDDHAWSFLRNENFNNLSEEVLVQILKRDTFRLPEIHIFKIVAQWCQISERTSNDLLKCVRFSDLTLEEISSVVKPTKLVDNDVLTKAIVEINGSKPRTPRWVPLCLPNINVANLQNIDGDVSFVIDEGDVVVRLEQPAYINNIKLLLRKKSETNYYRYYIEASIDGITWKNIIDYRNYDCRGLQELYFEKELVQYLKVVGVYSSEGNVIDVVDLEAYFRETTPKLVDGFVCPSTNVALLNKDAIMIEGIYNEMLKGRIKACYYTFHYIGKGSVNSIVIRLAQPFMINSIVLYLEEEEEDPYGDEECRNYKYFIEGSLNKSDWTVLADKRNVYCVTFEKLTFAATPLLYIRITGTHCSRGGIFRCNYIKCLASKDL